MPYTMTVYTKKSMVGHFTVEFVDQNGNKYLTSNSVTLTKEQYQ